MHKPAEPGGHLMAMLVTAAAGAIDYLTITQCSCVVPSCCAGHRTHAAGCWPHTITMHPTLSLVSALPIQSVTSGDGLFRWTLQLAPHSVQGAPAAAAPCWQLAVTSEDERERWTDAIAGAALAAASGPPLPRLPSSPTRALAGGGSPVRAPAGTSRSAADSSGAAAGGVGLSGVQGQHALRPSHAGSDSLPGAL